MTQLTSGNYCFNSKLQVILKDVQQISVLYLFLGKVTFETVSSIRFEYHEPNKLENIIFELYKEDHTM